MWKIFRKNLGKSLEKDGKSWGKVEKKLEKSKKQKIKKINMFFLAHHSDEISKGLKSQKLIFVSKFLSGSAHDLGYVESCRAS